MVRKKENIITQKPAVLFTNIGSVSRPKSSCYNFKVVIFLLLKGYKTFVFDYGTPYGFCALQYIKKFKPHFFIQTVSIKTYGSPVFKKNVTSNLILVATCDHCLGPVQLRQYMDVVRQCNCIATPEGVLLNKGKIPISLSNIKRRDTHD